MVLLGNCGYFFGNSGNWGNWTRRFGRASRPETQPVLETAPSTDRQEVLMLTIWEYNAKNNAKKLHCFSHYLTDPTILAYRITVSLGQKKSVQRKWHLGLSKAPRWHSLHATNQGPTGTCIEAVPWTNRAGWGRPGADPAVKTWMFYAVGDPQFPDGLSW